MFIMWIQHDSKWMLMSLHVTAWIFKIFWLYNILLPYLNLASTLPKMQLSHWTTSLDTIHQIASSGATEGFIQCFPLVLLKTCKLTLMCKLVELPFNTSLSELWGYTECWQLCLKAIVAVSLCFCQMSEHVGLVLSLHYLASHNHIGSIMVNSSHEGSKSICCQPWLFQFRYEHNGLESVTNWLLLRVT